MKKKILIVDDEPDLLKILSARLWDRGYTVVSAANAAHAKVLAKEQKPDLAILDIMLPDMSGPELANELKEFPETKFMPVIYLSAILSKSEEKKLGSNIAGEVIIAKPYDIGELETKIRQKLSEGPKPG